jgi:hypothetical protein
METKEHQKIITLINTEDLDLVKSFGLRWCIKNDKHTKTQYARSTKWEIINGKPKLITYCLHILLMNPTKGTYVDHINHDTLDNRRENLRIATNANNTSNRKSKNSNNTSGYRNVFWNSNKEQWQVSICKNYKHILIGYFDDVDEAGKEAEKAREEYFGEFKGKS